MRSNSSGMAAEVNEQFFDQISDRGVYILHNSEKCKNAFKTTKSDTLVMDMP